MEDKTSGIDPKAVLSSVIEIAQAVIRDPASFFRQMPRAGGYNDPLIFAVVMGFAAGIVRAVLSPFSPVAHGFLAAILLSIIVTPILIGLFSFVSASILFLIWQLMGSHQPYEVSYRIAAYALAICPITTAISLIPYLGVVAGLGWTAFIFVCASVELHGIKPKTAWIVFGAIFVVLAFGSVSLQRSARGFQHNMDQFGKKLGEIQKMKPEQAGQAVGEFLKGMEKGINKK
jgi:hypothetical protein